MAIKFPKKVKDSAPKRRSELLSLQGAAQTSPTERELARRSRVKALAKSKRPQGGSARTFKYMAISPLGQRITSTMIAPDKSAVAKVLMGDGWTPIVVEEIASKV